MSQKEDIKQLFQRYERGECSTEEVKRLHNWLNEYAKLEANGLNVLEEKYSSALQTNVRAIWVKWSCYAASVAVIILAMLWYINYNKISDVPIKAVFEGSDDITLPDYNQAIITLADGRKITLDEKASDLTIQESGVKISKAADGTILYESPEIGVAGQLKYNSFETPKGNTYAIILADGTKVWLNSSSKLSYPLHFANNERRVSLTGEAYFDVSHNPKQPFYVDIPNGTIKVLGTQFNVAAYENQKVYKTTLVEGAVEISNAGRTMSIKPNEQAIINANTGKITKTEIDVWPVLSWRNGYFSFERATLDEIFEEIGRWYDIDNVEYLTEVDNRFTGTFQRSRSISELLRYLEKLAPIHFEVKGRRVVVMQ